MVGVTEIILRIEHNNSLLEEILSELKKLNKKDEETDYHINYKDGHFRAVKFKNIISFFCQTNGTVVFIDNEMDYPPNDNFVSKEDGSEEFIKWFEEQKEKASK